MAKKLKIWNGRGHGKFDGGHVYVAAYTVREACVLVGTACHSFPCAISTSELNVYYHKGCWGNPMDGITPTEPCVYASIDDHEKPARII